MAVNRKNKLVLSIIFFGPLIFYLFLLTGTNNFAKLPVLTNKVNDVSHLKSIAPVTFQNNISIVCFLGDDLLQHKTNALNLNEKIYNIFMDSKIFNLLWFCQKGLKQMQNN